MSDIFISYSRLDREFVDELIDALERKGFDVWVDRKDISGGADWRAAISHAIRNCRAFLVVLSPNSSNSRKVVQELSLADQHCRQIIPLIHESCEITPDMDLQLATLHRIDFTETSFDDAMEQIEAALTKKSSGRQPSASGGKTPPRADRPAQPQPQQSQSPQPADSTGTPPSLASLLPGLWQIQITHLMSGMMGQLTVELMLNGMFQGQLFGPTGQTAVQGMWQITPLNQVVLQGQQSNGFQTIPYSVMLQFNGVSPNQLTGLSGAGEQVVCQRIR